MHVRFIIENGGRAASKLLDLPEVPPVGTLFQADRIRRAMCVTFDAERGEYAVYLAECAFDLAVYLQPAAHLERLDELKADGWAVEREAELRAWLIERIDRQNGGGPAAQS
ncbi:hypothetical protein [Sorangium sp. So ce861]|uniref:hypothetical protein n=1 Tax=Sorangium sp. So ce861 TaxID=3133323 RepID=UPI003F601CEB